MSYRSKNYACWVLCFALFVAHNVYNRKNSLSRKNVDMFSSVFKKIIPDATTPTFQEVGGGNSPSYFVKGIRFSHGIALTITKLIYLYSQGILTPLFAFVFNWNKPESQLVT